MFLSKGVISMDKEIMSELDERYVKRSEFMNSVTKLEKDVSIIKVMLVFIVLSSGSNVIQTIVNMFVK